MLQGGSGSANNIKFQNIKMHNVENPIIIDQNYCDQEKPCKAQVCGVKLKFQHCYKSLSTPMSSFDLFVYM